MVKASGRSPLVVWTAVGAALSVFFYFFFTNRLPLLIYRFGSVTFSDFAYHMIAFRAFWFEGAARIYSPETQVAVLGYTFGPELKEAMPIGVLPATLFLWFPFAALATKSIELAVALWCGLSLAVFLASVVETLPEEGGRRRLRLLVLASLPLITPLGVRALMLGQTSLFAAGAFVFFLASLMRGEASPIRMALLAVAISLKPAYAVFAFGALIAARDRKALLGAALGVLALNVFPALLAGRDLLPQYLETLKIYTAETIPAVYQHAINRGTMNLFVSASSVLLSTAIGLKVSTILYPLLSIGVILASLQISAPRETQVRVVSAFLLAVFLLFAPYAGAYEDLFFWPLCALLFLRRDTARGIGVEDGLLAVGILLLIESFVPSGGVVWLLKAAIISLLLRKVCRA